MSEKKIIITLVRLCHFSSYDYTYTSFQNTELIKTNYMRYVVMVHRVNGQDVWCYFYFHNGYIYPVPPMTTTALGN